MVSKNKKKGKKDNVLVITFYYAVITGFIVGLIHWILN
jgi:uncharacterized YccA/Bax inhibitor family protein